MKYFKSKSDGYVYRLIHRGENYVFGFNKGCPDTLGFAAAFNDRQWEEWVEEPKVGDTVRIKGGTTQYTLLYIHQEEGDDRRWGVVAFKGGIPMARFMRNLEKVDG